MLHILSRMKPFFGGAKVRALRRIPSRALKPRVTLLEPRALLSSFQGLGISTSAAAMSVHRSAVVRDAAPEIKVLSLSSAHADPTKTVLTVNRTNATKYQQITLTATVTNVDFFHGFPGEIPSGTVKFMDGTKVLAQKALFFGDVEFTAKSLGVGKHVLKAVYEGDKIFARSASKTVTVTIIP
jgi:hypothetical protein